MSTEAALDPRAVAHLKAVERAMKLKLLASRLPAQIAQAEQEVIDTAAALGIDPPGHRRNGRPKTGAAPPRNPDSLSGRVRAILANGPATVEQLYAQLPDVDQKKVRTTVDNLGTRGHAERVPETFPAVYRLIPKIEEIRNVA